MNVPTSVLTAPGPIAMPAPGAPKRVKPCVSIVSGLVEVGRLADNTAKLAVNVIVALGSGSEFAAAIAARSEPSLLAT